MKTKLSLVLILSLMMVGAISGEVIFSDDFEDGTLENWDTEGSGAGITEDSYEGDYAAILDGDATSPNERIITLGLDSTGFKNIIFSYWIKTENLGVSDAVYLKYSINDGATWADAEPSFKNNINPYEQKMIDLSALDERVENNSQLKIKFALKDVNDLTHTAKIDDVMITGDEAIAPEISNLTVEPNFPKTTDSIEVCAEIGDESEIDSVKLTCASDQHAFTEFSMSLDGNHYCTSLSTIFVDGEEMVCSVEAEDEWENSATSEEISFVFDGLAPSVDFTCNVTEGIEPLVIRCESDSTDTVDSDLEHFWTFNDDEIIISTEKEVEGITYLQNGEYSVTLVVTDDSGRSSEKTITIEVEDTNPNAEFEMSESKVEGEEIEFTDLSTSYDEIVSWLWNFGDGSTSTEQNATHTYFQNGSYTVSLTITEEDGNVAVVAVAIEVIDKSPLVNLTIPGNIFEGTSRQYQLQIQSSPDVVSAGTCKWYIDGILQSGKSSCNYILFTFISNGVYNITVIIPDSDSQTIVSENAIVLDTAPVANFVVSNENPNEGEEITFTDNSTAYDTPMSYYWNFNNGMGSTEKNPTNIFVQDGEYNVTLVVTDNDGTQNLTSKIIVVKNVAPEFENLDASVRAVRGELFEFDVDASDASSIDEISYSAEMPEGMEINSSTGAISWTPTASQLGIHSIIITVSDGDDSTSATLTIEVFADAIGLDEGWNLISLPLVPEDTSIESVLSEIQSSVRKVWSLQYNEESEKNEWIYKEVEEGEFLSGELEELTSGEGYYIQMNENSVLYTTGNKMYSQGKMAIPPSKKVDEGWNLIGKYGLNEELSNTEAFATLTGEVPSLIDKNGNTIEEMEISEGYWAFVTGGVQIYAPSSEAYSY